MDVTQNLLLQQMLCFTNRARAIYFFFSSLSVSLPLIPVLPPLCDFMTLKPFRGKLAFQKWRKRHQTKQRMHPYSLLSISFAFSRENCLTILFPVTYERSSQWGTHRDSRYQQSDRDSDGSHAALLFRTSRAVLKK